MNNCAIVDAQLSSQSWLLDMVKTDKAPKDLLFIALSVLKAVTNLYLMGKIFDFGEYGSTLQKCFTSAIDILTPLIYQAFVIHYSPKLAMSSFTKKGLNLKTFPMLFMPLMWFFSRQIFPQESGTFLKGKLYFRGKHQLYQYKTELSVNPNGQAIDVTGEKPVCSSDLFIFQWSIALHNQGLKKSWQRWLNCWQVFSVDDIPRKLGHSNGQGVPKCWTICTSNYPKDKTSL